MNRRRATLAAAAITGTVALTACHSTNIQLRADWNPDGAFAYDNDIAAGGVGFSFACSTGWGHPAVTEISWEGWKPPTAGETWTSPPKQCPNWAPHLVAGTLQHWEWH